MDSGQALYVLLVIDLPVPTPNDLADASLRMFLDETNGIAGKYEGTKALSRSAWMLPVASALRSLHEIVGHCTRAGYSYQTYLLNEEPMPITY